MSFSSIGEKLTKVIKIAFYIDPHKEKDIENFIKIL